MNENKIDECRRVTGVFFKDDVNVESERIYLTFLVQDFSFQGKDIERRRLSQR